MYHYGFCFSEYSPFSHFDLLCGSFVATAIFFATTSDIDAITLILHLSFF